MNKVERFKKLTATMDIPKERREPTKANLGWFFRNIHLRNGSHPNIIQAWDIAKEIDKELSQELFMPDSLFTCIVLGTPYMLARLQWAYLHNACTKSFWAVIFKFWVWDIEKL